MTQLNTSILDAPVPELQGSGSRSLVPDMAEPLAPAALPTKPAVPQAPLSLRAFGDVAATRKAIFDKALEAARSLPDIENPRHILRLANVDWADPEAQFGKADRKKGILTGGSLGRRLRGTWQLYDKTTGKLIDEKQATLGRIPYLTEGGTFVAGGNEYVLKNQQRLCSGVFARRKDNGEIESHANVLANGPSHRYFLDPDKGLFYIRIGQSQIPLMPLLKAMGASDQELREGWGADLYAANYAKGDASALAKLKARVLKDKPFTGTLEQALRENFEKMQLDPEVTKRTLGGPHDRLSKDAILATTKKLLAISRKEADPDDRDHLAYQAFLGPEDLIAERIRKDRAGLRRTILWKASGKGSTANIPAMALQSQIDSALMESGLGQALEEINPAEILDKMTQISRMGEGGIPSYDAVPDEARAVQPSHMGFMDPLRTPESFRVGVDVFLSGNVRKGNDGQLYSRFRDVKSGQEVWKTPRQVAETAIAFPGELASGSKRVRVMENGRITYKPRAEVQLELPHMEHAFSPLGNLIPLKSQVKGQRVAMASRMTTQALPLVNAEAPLVQSGMPGSAGNRSYEDEYGVHMGAIRASQGGKVVAAGPGELQVRYDNGKTERIELYDHHPFNRKTFLHQTPALQPGDRFAAGDLLAKSNYTDGQGATALGVNARVAYMPWGGMNFEDAVVISESMAKRMTSEHMYQHELSVGDRTRTGKNAYISLFPAKYNKDMLAKLDDKGVIKPGTEVRYGDPLILAATERSQGLHKIHKQGQPGFNDSTITWEHHDPGVVVDVADGRDGPVVTVKSLHAMQVGDKMSGRYGDKGVVSAIVPDDQMPHDKTGKPFEVLLNDLSTIRRTNPAQHSEGALGKLAAKLGKPFKVEDFDPNVPDRLAWVEQQLAKHGLSYEEDVIDPAGQRKVPGVKAGVRFFMKLHHTAESKGQGRSGGGYTAEETPAKGGETGAKRIALMDVNALLSHGATAVLRDAGAIRGQRNEDYWLQFMQGFTPRQPKVPLVYEKFVNELKASGINVVRQGSQVNVMALTDKDLDQLAGNREITSGETVSFDKDLAPVPGGLFDPEKTGGHHGNRWSAIKLTEPMPNPVMEEPIRRVLGLTQKKFEAVLGGQEALGEKTGPAAIAEALDKLDLKRELLIARNKVQYGTQTERDAAVRKLGYLKSAERLGIHPRDWMLKRAPVLPPQFRPVNVMSDRNIPLVADANFLYKELIEANKNLAEMKQAIGDKDVGTERLAVYHAFKAVTGLGDPITQQNKDRQVRGILAGIFGSSPKFGTVQRKLLSSAVDNVGRAVISPNPDLDMDQVGLPEDRAFNVYSRFIVRRLRRQGMPITRALQEVKDQSKLARAALLEEMNERPVIINRAPVLHRFGIMAFRPVLTKGSTMQVSPLITKGFNADFDGDAMQYHVPVDEEARKEALDRMLPSRQLLSPADFKSPVHHPSMEYLAGLYQASTHNSKRPVRTFATVADMKKAWQNHEIGIGDPVRILQ